MREQGKYADARRLAEEAYATVKASGELHESMFALYHMGRIAFLQNDLERATACLGESLRQCEGTNQHSTILSSAMFLAAVHIRRGDLMKAVGPLREADRILRESGGQIVGLFLNVLGAFVAQLRPADAVKIYGAVGAHAEAIGVVVEDEPWIAQVKGDLRAHLGDAAFEEAFQVGQCLSVDSAVELMRDALDSMVASTVQ
jgi:hypothetical protein